MAFEGSLKAAKYEIQKPSKVSRNIVSLPVLGQCFAFFTLRATKMFVAASRKLLRKVERRSQYFEQQMLALLLVFHKTYNLSRNKFAHVARQVEGFCISYFVALSDDVVWQYRFNYRKRTATILP